MKRFHSANFTVEQIMTPRSVLRCVEVGQIALAQKLAEEKDFNAIPILERGAIRQYWSREAGHSTRITHRQRIAHDSPIEVLLPRLQMHGVQFVYYRTEVVGLVDLSDLNKPVARLVWLHPMLECEQRIIERTVQLGIEDAVIQDALGRAARPAARLQEKALQENLRLPLLSFVFFYDVLRAAVMLGIISLSIGDIRKLNGLRNRAAHTGRSLIENKSQCEELNWAKMTCQRILKEI